MLLLALLLLAFISHWSVVCYADSMEFEFNTAAAGCTAKMLAPEEILHELERGLVRGETACFGSHPNVSVTRNLQKEGFHRTVLIELSVANIPPDCRQCKFLLLQFLPEGLYVDTYQLKFLQDLGVLTLAEIDVEQPAHSSPNHTIAIYPTKVQRDQGHLTASMELPIHLRYHMPSVDASRHHSLVSLPPPDVLIHCQGCPQEGCTETPTSHIIQAPCTAANHSLCGWTHLPCVTNTLDELVFHVPIGQEGHSTIVTAVSLAVVLGGMVALLVSLMRTEQHTECTSRRKKQMTPGVHLDVHYAIKYVFKEGGSEKVLNRRLHLHGID